MKRISKKISIIRIKEVVIEVTPEEEEEYLGKMEFVCIGLCDNYSDLVNSAIEKNEIGYIFENGIKKRIVSRIPTDNIDTRRRKYAKLFAKRYPEFVPYWKFGELADCKELEIGRMFGCRITLRN